MTTTTTLCGRCHNFPAQFPDDLCWACCPVEEFNIGHEAAIENRNNETRTEERTMHYELGFQHPDTGTWCVAKWCFGKITIKVDEETRECNCEEHSDEGCEMQDDKNAIYETKRLLEQYQGMRCSSLDDAEFIGRKMASDQYDYGWERID
jgi:hypothetical protein